MLWEILALHANHRRVTQSVNPRRALLLDPIPSRVPQSLLAARWPPWHEARLPNKAMRSKYGLMQRSLKRASSAMIALVTAAAWFLAANHCAVANLAPKPDEHEHCASGAPADEGKPNDCDGLNCCKSLSAPAVFAKKLVGYDKAFFTLQDYIVGEFAFPTDQHDALISELDTGPPRPNSFVESVLQRSLLAHAPPFFS